MTNNRTPAPWDLSQAITLCPTMDASLAFESNWMVGGSPLVWTMIFLVENTWLRTYAWTRQLEEFSSAMEYRVPSYPQPSFISFALWNSSGDFNQTLPPLQGFVSQSSTLSTRPASPSCLTPSEGHHPKVLNPP